MSKGPPTCLLLIDRRSIARPQFASFVPLIVWAIGIACILGATPRVDAAGEAMIELSLGAHRVRGMVLGWSEQQALLLRRDGQIMKFQPSQTANVKKSATPFLAMNGAEIRGPLLREFGPNYDVQAAGSYVVVYPKDRPGDWAGQFDQLHRSFLQYFSARGVATAKPRFPLVAVVLPDRNSFLRYAARDGAKLPDNCAGYYSNFTNRVVQYDHGSGNNQELIIHEASHQVAFNIGIHHRGSPPPRWLTEGLGTMFEARGVWNSAQYPRRKDRINRGQLAAFRRYLEKRPSGSLAEFVSNEWLFRTDVGAAYGQSWALSFFLSETNPRGWAQYLRATGDVKRAQMSQPELLLEFTQVFGRDLRSLESRFLAFIETL